MLWLRTACWLQTKQTAEKNADKQTLELAKEELAQIESDQDRIRSESVLVNLIVEDDAKALANYLSTSLIMRSVSPRRFAHVLTRQRLRTAPFTMS